MVISTKLPIVKNLIEIIILIQMYQNDMKMVLDQSINLLLFLQKQNLATAIYLFGLGTLLIGTPLYKKDST